MIWNHTDKSKLKMKNLSLEQIKTYLENIKTEILLSYGVYQIEAGGLDLFDEIEGDKKFNNGASHKINKEILRKYKMKRFFIIEILSHIHYHPLFITIGLENITLKPNMDF